MKRNILKSLLLLAGLFIGLSGIKAAAGDVITNADIDFSNPITDNVVAGAVNSMTIATDSKTPTEITAEGYLKMGKGTNTVTIAEDQRAGAKDIVTVQFKLAMGKLTNRAANFSMKDADGAEIASFSYNAYQGELTNTLGVVREDMYSSKNTAAENGFTTFTVTFDYKQGLIITETQSDKATNKNSTYTVSMTNRNAIATFNVGSNYDNTDRRCMFDDLVIKTALGDYSTATAGYTLKYMLGDTELKTVERTGDIGAAITLLDSEKQPFYSEDGTVKYFYVSDDAEGKTVTEDGATVITVTCRVAETWTYTMVAVDPDNNILKEAVATGSGIEGEKVTVNYPYAVNNGGTLYKAKKLSSDGKGYYFDLVLESANTTKNITYTASDITGVVYFSEGEEIPGAKVLKGANGVIRASNGSTGYNDEKDLTLTSLANGKYKLTAGVFDAGKTADVSFDFACGNNILFTATASGTNLTEHISDEFELNGAANEIVLKAGGSEDKERSIDYVYIQKTGDADVVVSYAAGEMNFNAMADLPVSSSSSTEGDILENKTMTADEFSVTISPKVSNNTNNRFWSTADGPQLRIYNGTLTVTAAAGKTLNRIEFGVDPKNWGTITPDNGTLEGTVWTGEAETVVFTIASQCRINSITVGEKKAPATPVAANIAELKNMENGAEVALTLTDAKVTVCDQFRWSKLVIIEDATGAIQIPDGMQMAQADAFAKSGVVLNGTLIGTFVNEFGTIGIDESENTANSNVTVTDAAIEPTVKTIAEAKNPEWSFRFVKFENVEWAYNADEYRHELKQGDETIELVDMLQKMEYDDNYSLVVYNKLKFINGIIYDDGMGGYMFVPVGDPVFEADATEEPQPEANKYAVAEGEAHQAGDQITSVADMVMTYGAAGDVEFKAGKANDAVDGFVAFCEGNGANPADADGQGFDKSGNVPTVGTFYTFEPKYDGDVTVGVVLNAGKKFFVLEDGVALPDFNGITEAEKYYGTYNFQVSGGKKYHVFCTGSKLGFYGFIYNSKGTVDAINGVNVETVNANIYNMNGTMVRKAGESKQGLAKGLYIMGGKKIVIK